MKSLVFAVLPLLGAAAAPGQSLDGLSTIRDRTSHRASSWDRTGGNNDSLGSFAPGDTQVLLDTDGPGRLTHMWFTVARFPGHEYVLRDIALRIYWENSPVPSVEVPLGDFFGLGHGRLYAWQSLPLAVGSNPCAMNCYWPMPFYRHARVEIVNNGRHSIRRLYYNLDYELGAIPAGEGLFHALYSRNRALGGQSERGNLSGADNYVILETEGRGQYVGCTLAVDAQPGGWWGEGDDMIFIDHSDKPVITGTGSEDYFCNAWGYKDAFSYPFYGAPLLEDQPDGRKLAVVYRWHVADPVRFRSHVRVTIEHLWAPDVLNDFTSVAYWYQAEPMRQRSPLPPAAANQPGAVLRHVDGSELEADCLARGIKARTITVNLGEGYSQGGWLKVEAAGRPVDLRVPVPGPGSYQIKVKPVNHLLESPVTFRLKGGEATTVKQAVSPGGKPAGEGGTPFVDLGVAPATGDFVEMNVTAGTAFGIDGFIVFQVPDAGR